MQPGDAIWLVISPRSSYGYDTTIIELEISESDQPAGGWSLARDVIADPPDAQQINPHPDALGNAGVWAFLDLVAISDAAGRVRPDSLLARWFEAIDGPGSPADRRARAEPLATALERSLLAAATAPADEVADQSYADLTAANGPFRPADVAADESLLDENRDRIAAVRERDWHAGETTCRTDPVGQWRPGGWCSANDL